MYGLYGFSKPFPCPLVIPLIFLVFSQPLRFSIATIRKLTRDSIFGTDADSRAARSGKMSMIVHVAAANSVLPSCTVNTGAKRVLPPVDVPLLEGEIGRGISKTGGLGGEKIAQNFSLGLVR